MAKLVDIQEILNRDKKKKTFLAFGNTFVNKVEFHRRGWKYSRLKGAWEYKGYETDLNVSFFREAKGIFIKEE